MTRPIGRMDFLKLLGYGGLVFASGIKGFAAAGGAEPEQDFCFAQLSDSHWGFQGPKINPDAAGTLEKAVGALNALPLQPDFVVFTGDLTHDTEDPGERRARMVKFKEIVTRLKVRDLRFLPGEHDASADHGEAFKELFGPTHYTFDHKGIHFIALDNVSQQGNVLGKPQLGWLADDLKGVAPEVPVVVFAHRPLFDLYRGMGLDHRRRGPGHRPAAGPPQRDRVLRPHPPGAPPHDRGHRPPRGQVADLPAAGAGLRAQARPGALGSGQTLPGPGPARSGRAHLARRPRGRPADPGEPAGVPVQAPKA